MTLTNIVAEFYGGELRGNLVSRFNDDRSADLAFHLETKHTELTELDVRHLGKKIRVERPLGRGAGHHRQLEGLEELERVVQRDSEGGIPVGVFR